MKTTENNMELHPKKVTQMQEQLDMTIDTPNYFGIVPKEFESASNKPKERALAFYLRNVLDSVPGYTYDGLTQLAEDLKDK